MEIPGARKGAECKQKSLEEEAMKMIRECGGVNYIQGQFLKEAAAEIAQNTDNPNLSCLWADVKLFENKAWNQALFLSVAYLKRHKMMATLETMRTEFDSTPKSTGFTKAKEVDDAFADLLEMSKILHDVSFEHKVEYVERHSLQ